MSDAPTHAIRIFLTNGCVVDTQESFGADEDPHEVILAHLDDRECQIKGIGDTAIHFKYIAGFQIINWTELYPPGKLVSFPDIQEGSSAA